MPNTRKSRRKPKVIAYEFIDPTSAVGAPMYAMLRRLAAEHHEELFEARIALAWCLTWKPDLDGRVTLGKCKKASDLDRELAAFDFVILLRRTFWCDLRVTDSQRQALLDHELTHASVTYDEDGEVKVDDRGRQVYRIRKHDIEEFATIVERHGLWTADLEKFAAALRRTALAPFEPCAACRDEIPGWRLTANDTSGVTRCACYLQWANQRAAIDAEEKVAL